MIKKISISSLLLGSLMLSTLCFAASYQLIDPPQPTQTADKIEVVEVFWYACPHCYDFEPYLEKWMENKPEDVHFRRMPGIFSNDWVPHARAFFVAQELDVLDKIHRPLFAAIHAKNRQLHDEKSLRAFFVEQGIDGDLFTSTYNSDKVDEQVRSAFSAGKKYRLSGVPAVIVNGRYRTGASMAGSYQKLINTMNELIAKER